MTHHTLTALLGLSIILASGCGNKEASQPKVPSAQIESSQLPPPALPRLGFTVLEGATVFTDGALSKPYSALPVLTQVSIHDEGSDHYEIRVSSSGKIYTAYMRRSDILVGNRDLAMASVRARQCATSVAQPDNSTLLMGMLKDGKRLPDYEGSQVDPEDFLDLGLDLIEIHGEAIAAELETPHRIKVSAPLERDAFVKIKDQKEALIAGFYVRAGQPGMVDVPNGQFITYFSTGKKFSAECGVFLEDLTVSKDAQTLNFSEDAPPQEVSYSLVARPSRPSSLTVFSPQTVSEDEFLK